MVGTGNKQKKKFIEFILKEQKVFLWEEKNVGQKKLGPFEGKSHGQIREMLNIKGKQKEEIKQMKGFSNYSEAKITKMLGTGINSLNDRLYLGISSLHAGNTSVKLKKEIQSTADQLLEAKVISKEQRNKILSLK